MTEGQGGGTPAGWYPDPEGNGERWWNGMSWGQLRQPPAAPQQYAQHQPAGQHAMPGQSQAQQVPSSGQWAQQQQQQGQAQAQAPAQQPAPGQHPGAAGLRCLNCQFTDFTQADFVLTPGGGAIFDRGVGMATATCLICRRCGFIHWFATR